MTPTPTKLLLVLSSSFVLLAFFGSTCNMMRADHPDATSVNGVPFETGISVEEIGFLHNQALAYALGQIGPEHMPISSTVGLFAISVTEQFMDLEGISEDGMTDTIESVVHRVVSSDRLDLVPMHLHNYFELIHDFIIGEVLPVDLNAQLEDVLAVARVDRTLTAEDLITVEVMVTVASYSYDYWYYSLEEWEAVFESASRSSVGDIVAWDVAGAAGGLTGGAIRCLVTLPLWGKCTLLHGLGGAVGGSVAAGVHGVINPGGP